MICLRFGLLMAIASAGCNYLAPFDPEDQPLRPPDTADANDMDDADVSDADRDDDEHPPECLDCEGRACGPDGCGGTCGPGCNEGAGEVCVVDVDHANPSPTAPYSCVAPEPGRWVFITHGVFAMGSPSSEVGRGDGDMDRHDVSLNHDFIIYSSEFDQGEVGSMLQGRDPSHFVDTCSGSCPGEHLTWHEAAAATNYMSQEHGLPQCYACELRDGEHRCQLAERWSSPYECPGFRLPTEAEWEYAARAGSDEATYAGNLSEGDVGCLEVHQVGEVAWFCGNAEESTHPIGTKRHNDWGLYDMLGNVAEWCHDFYDATSGQENAVDPWGPSEGTRRAYRGGSWEDGLSDIRAAARDGLPPDTRDFIGLRPVRTVQQPATR